VNRPPWSLALVSRFWRHSALSYHHLWRYIEIWYSKRGSLDEMNLQLACAADAPLEIAFHCGPNGCGRHGVLELIVQHRSHWRTVHLSGLFSERLVDMLNLTKSKLKRLETLEVAAIGTHRRSAGFFPMLQICVQYFLRTGSIGQALRLLCYRGHRPHTIEVVLLRSVNSTSFRWPPIL
jgi:hypothetical protein